MLNMQSYLIFVWHHLWERLPVVGSMCATRDEAVCAFDDCQPVHSHCVKSCSVQEKQEEFGFSVASSLNQPQFGYSNARNWGT